MATRPTPADLIPAREVERTGDDTPAASVFAYVWRMSGWHQLAVCALAGAVAAISMAPLELQRRIVNNAVGAADLSLLWWLGGVYAGVVALQVGLKYALRVYQGWLGESAVRYTRGHLSGIFQDRVAREEEGGEGEAVSIIGAEVEKLGGFVGEGPSQFVVNAGMLVAIIGYMVVVQPMIAMFGLAFIVPQVVAAPLLQRWVNQLLKRRVEHLRRFGAMLTEEDDADETALRGQLDRVFGNRMRIYLLKFAQKGFVGLMNALAPLAALVFGGYMVIEGQTTIGVVVAFVSGFDKLADPVRELVAWYRSAAQANVQHDMIARWM